MPLTAVFERFDSSTTHQTLQFGNAGDPIVLVPVRSPELGMKIVGWRRYNLTEQVVDGLPLYKQSIEAFDLELGDKTVRVTPHS